MGRKIIFNNMVKFIDSSNINISSPALNFGLGLFETVLYHSGKLFFHNEHLERLRHSCAELKIPLPDTDLVSEDKVLTLISMNNMTGRTLRLKLLYAPLSDLKKWDIIVKVSEYVIPENAFTAETDLLVRDDYIKKHKTISYMRNFLSAAKRNNISETLFLNGRSEIIEGSRTNVLCLKAGKVYFTGRNENYLQGIMQKKIIKDCLSFGLEAAELQGGFDTDMLENAEEVILTNSLILSAPVTEIVWGRNNYKYTKTELSKKLRGFYLK